MLKPPYFDTICQFNKTKSLIKMKHLLILKIFNSLKTLTNYDYNIINWLVCNSFFDDNNIGKNIRAHYEKI